MTQTPASSVAPASAPVTADEELLDVNGVRWFVGVTRPVSRWWIDKYSRLTEDPLPWIGTARMRRMRKSALVAWLERHNNT